MENQDNSGHNIFCAKCGVALDPTVRFCPACGQEVQPVPIRPVLPVPQPLPPPPVIQVPSGVGSSERGVVCPRCGSDQVHAEKRGWRWTDKLSANRRDLLIAPLLAAIPTALLGDRA